jgi:hypothetical protein
MRYFRALDLRVDVIAGYSIPVLSLLGMEVSIHALARDGFLDHLKRSRCNALDRIEMRIVCRDKNKQKNTSNNRQ